MSCTITWIASTTRAPESMQRGSLPVSSPTEDRHRSIGSSRPHGTACDRPAQRQRACHDDLAVPNEPVLFHSFAEHAGRHGLRYLAEAELHTMDVTGISSEAQAFLSTLDPLACEQYLDFVRLRRFRQSLLVRHDSLADTRTSLQRLGSMHVSATFELARAAAAGGIHKLARKVDPAAGGGGPVRKLLDELVARHRQRWKSPRSTAASISVRCPGPSRMS